MQYSLLTFQSLLVTWCTKSLTLNNCTLCPSCIYVFCIYLRTDLCHLHHKLMGFYNRDEKCLLRSMDWGFKYNSLRFVSKGLNVLCLLPLHLFFSFPWIFPIGLPHDLRLATNFNAHVSIYLSPEYFASIVQPQFLVSREFSGAGCWAYQMWLSGEGWVCICL